MNNPKISVIVPVYNVEKLLHRCIDSILAQTFTDFELLLIDDGSKDKSGVICDEYAEKDYRVRTFHKLNGGVSSARNIGLDNSRGEWICFVDSDDYVNNVFLESWRLQSSIDLIIQGYWNVINDGQKKDKVLMEDICGNDINAAISILSNYKNVGYLWCRCFKHDIIDRNKIRFNERFKIQEDEQFIWHYMKYCKFLKVIASSNYYYIVPNYEAKYKDVDAESVINCNIDILKNRLYIQNNCFNCKDFIPYVERIVKAYILLFSNRKINEDYCAVLREFYSMVKSIKISRFLSLRTRLFLSFYRNSKCSNKYILLANLFKILD